MGQTARFQEILRRLAIMDEGIVQDQAGLGLGQAGPWVMDPKTAALVQMGALVAIGSPAVCLEWGVSRALAAGATEDEITDVLLAVAPAAGEPSAIIWVQQRRLDVIPQPVRHADRPATGHTPPP